MKKTKQILKSAEELADELANGEFKGYNLGILHGKMKPKDKEAIMKSFASGKVSLLVATTVVEVGVDVPNATIMVIENAERFGLSTLHQLRGRVGRGNKKKLLRACIRRKGRNRTRKAYDYEKVQRRFQNCRYRP